MEKIVIYDDADYGLTVELGDYCLPCDNKDQVIMAVDDYFCRLRETTEDEREE